MARSSMHLVHFALAALGALAACDPNDPFGGDRSTPTADPTIDLTPGATLARGARASLLAIEGERLLFAAGNTIYELPTRGGHASEVLRAKQSIVSATVSPDWLVYSDGSRPEGFASTSSYISSIYRVPRAPGSPLLIATVAPDPGSGYPKDSRCDPGKIDTDGSRLLWVDCTCALREGTIDGPSSGSCQGEKDCDAKQQAYATALAGKVVVEGVSLQTGDKDRRPSCSATFVRQGDVVYFAQTATIYDRFAYKTTHDARLIRVARDGAKATLLASTSPIGGLAADESGVYASVREGVARVDPNGSIEALATPSAEQLSDVFFEGFGEVALDAEHVYFGEILRVRKQGGSPERLINALQPVRDLRTDERALYWSNGSFIKKSPKRGEP